MVDAANYVPGTFPPCTTGSVYTDWFVNEEGMPTVRYHTLNGVWVQVVEAEEFGHKTYEVTWDKEVKPHPATTDGHQPRLFTDMMEAVRFAKRLIQ